MLHDSGFTAGSFGGRKLVICFPDREEGKKVVERRERCGGWRGAAEREGDGCHKSEGPLLLSGCSSGCAVGVGGRD